MMSRVEMRLVSSFSASLSALVLGEGDPCCFEETACRERRVDDSILEAN